MCASKVAAFAAVLSTLTATCLPGEAETLITTHRLPLTLAARGSAAALAACEAKGFKVTVAVVGREGDMQVLSRADGAGVQTVQSATDKAITSAVFGLDSGYWVERAEKGMPISPLLNQLPNLLLARGGVVLEVNEEIIGGLAVAGAPGGEIDESCAQAGRDAILAALH